MYWKYLEGEIFPEQAASDANLTAIDGYIFGYLLTKKKKFDFSVWEFFLYS